MSVTTRVSPVRSLGGLRRVLLTGLDVDRDVALADLDDQRVAGAGLAALAGRLYQKPSSSVPSSSATNVNCVLPGAPARLLFGATISALADLLEDGLLAPGPPPSTGSRCWSCCAASRRGCRPPSRGRCPAAPTESTVIGLARRRARTRTRARSLRRVGRRGLAARADRQREQRGRADRPYDSYLASHVPPPLALLVRSAWRRTSSAAAAYASPRTTNSLSVPCFGGREPRCERCRRPVARPRASGGFGRRRQQSSAAAFPRRMGTTLISLRDAAMVGCSRPRRRRAGAQAGTERPSSCSARFLSALPISALAASSAPPPMRNA